MSYTVRQGIGAANPVCPSGETWDGVKCAPSVGAPVDGRTVSVPPCVDVLWTDTNTGHSDTHRFCKSCSISGPYVANSDQKTFHVVQQMLRDLGFYAGPVDGDTNPDVIRESLRAFAKATGLVDAAGFLPGTQTMLGMVLFTPAGQPNPILCEALERAYYRWQHAKELEAVWGPGKGGPSGGSSSFVPGSQLFMPGGSLPPAPVVPIDPTLQPSPAPPPLEPSSGGGVMDLWNGLSTTEKVLVVGGSVGALVLGAVLLKKAFRPNRRKYGTKVVHRGREIGRTSAPEKYRRLGARRATQYAWPKGYLYPIHDAKHTRLASARFAKWKRHYPKSMQRVIAKRIDAAKRRFHIAEYRRAS